MSKEGVQNDFCMHEWFHRMRSTYEKDSSLSLVELGGRYFYLLEL